MSGGFGTRGGFSRRKNFSMLRQAARSGKYTPATKAYVKTAIKRATRKNWQSAPFVSSCIDTRLCVPTGDVEDACAVQQLVVLANGEPGSPVGQEDVSLVGMRGGFWVRDGELTVAAGSPLLVRIGSYLGRRDRGGALLEKFNPSDADDMSEAPWRRWLQFMLFPLQSQYQSNQRQQLVTPQLDDTCSTSLDGRDVNQYLEPCEVNSWAQEARPVYIPWSRVLPRCRLREDQALVLALAWTRVGTCEGESPIAAPSLLLYGGGALHVAHGS